MQGTFELAVIVRTPVHVHVWNTPEKALFERMCAHVEQRKRAVFPAVRYDRFIFEESPSGSCV